MKPTPDADDPAELALFRRAQAGEALAKAAVLSDLCKKATRAALKVVGSREEAEEIGQDAVMVVMDYLADFETPRQVRAAVGSTATHDALDRVRRRKIAAGVVERLEESPEKTPVPNAEAELAEEEGRRRIWGEVERLPGPGRRAMELLLREQLPRQEVAKRTRQSLAEVDNLMKRFTRLMRGMED